MTPTGESVAQLIEVAPRLARQLGELIGSLCNERVSAAMTPENVTQFRRALAASMEHEGIPHRIDTKPVSIRDLERQGRQRAAARRELEQQIKRDWQAFTGAFENQRSTVAGLLHRPFFECSGHAKAASACEALFQCARWIVKIIDARPLLLDDLGASDRDDNTWHELQLGIEVEMAELQRRETNTTQPSRHGLTPIEFAFFRALCDANGERLDYQGIFLAAQKKDAAMFKAAKPNTWQTKLIRGLIGRVADGKRVCGTGGLGTRREFWTESAR